MGNIYHVSKRGSDKNSGMKDYPFLTIQRSADIAVAGDTVIVHEGEYREWVRPRNSGLHETCRIVYQAAEGEHVVIKGSERITDWELVEGTVWKVVLPNSFFGEENPYALTINGDWLDEPTDIPMHRGDVYLNGKSLYEAKNFDEVCNPQMRLVAPYEKHKKKDIQMPEPQNTIYQWWANVDEATTVIYANFHGANPNEELTEINVRSCCFYPEVTGLNYITVRGFEMAHAATPWTPPTADQPGLLGANWSKGWIIENNHIHDAKCSAISIGKEVTTGDNDHTKRYTKSGYQNQVEVVFRAKKIGWSKETIGSHIVRNNVIHDCGQNGIVGHMGCAFSQIYGNEVYNIGTKYEFYGHEIAGIKFHAPIDTQICHNYVHHCSLGIWLDWEVQGTRISGNLLDANNSDIKIEVTHGPHIVDNNIFTSNFSVINASQGGAYIHNLFGGFMRQYPILNRSTPYHYPHSTDIQGVAFVYGGDERWFQNIFIGGVEESPKYIFGMYCYDESSVSVEEYIERLKALGIGDHDLYFKEKQPVYINQNVYCNGAQHFDREETYCNIDANPNISIKDEGDAVYLELCVDESMLQLSSNIVSTETLGVPRIVEQRFDNPDGTDIFFNQDMIGVKRKTNPTAGPIEYLKPGYNKIKIWERK